MALIYHKTTINKETKDVIVRPLVDDGEYAVALSFPDEEDEDAVTEILLTEEEVKEAYDLLFNR